MIDHGSDDIMGRSAVAFCRRLSEPAKARPPIAISPIQSPSVPNFERLMRAHFKAVAEATRR